MNQQFLTLGERIVLAARMAAQQHVQVISESDVDFTEDCELVEADEGETD